MIAEFTAVTTSQMRVVPFPFTGAAAFTLASRWRCDQSRAFFERAVTTADDAGTISTLHRRVPLRLRTRHVYVRASSFRGGMRWLRPSCSLRQPPSSHFIPQHLLNGFSLGDQATHAETGGRLSVSASPLPKRILGVDTFKLACTPA